MNSWTLSTDIIPYGSRSGYPCVRLHTPSAAEGFDTEQLLRIISSCRTPFHSILVFDDRAARMLDDEYVGLIQQVCPVALYICHYKDMPCVRKADFISIRFQQSDDYRLVSHISADEIIVDLKSEEEMEALAERVIDCTHRYVLTTDENEHLVKKFILGQSGDCSWCMTKVMFDSVTKTELERMYNGK